MTFNALEYGNGTAEVWYDVSDASTLTLTGSVLDSIVDKSGNSITGTGTGAARPTYNATGLNSLPTLVFDDTHAIVFAQLPGISTESTVFVVAESDQDNSANTFGNMIGINNTGGGAQRLPLVYFKKADASLVVNVSYPSLDAISFTNSDGIANQEPFIAYSTLSTGGAVEAGVFREGIASVKTGTPTITTNGNTSAIGDGAKGNFSELIVYSSKLSKEEIDEILFELGKKWNIFTPKPIAETSQDLSSDRLVKLYEIDATLQGGSLLRFCSAVDATNEISSISFSGTTATAITTNPHTLTAADSINISGVNQSPYNGDFTAATVISSTSFTYTMLSTPTENAEGANMVLARLNNVMVFNGNDYTPIAFESEGFEWSGKGALPTPRIRVSNVGKVLAAAVISLNDLVGAKFTRIRTFRKYLDDGSDPDIGAIFPREVYNINRKSVHNKIFLEFELASSMDQEAVKIPGRQCIKRVCTHTYRVWTGSAFDNTNATCPYTGASSFDNLDNSTTDANDQCAKQLNSCKIRFVNDPLPTRAFPGIGGAS